MVLLLVLIQDFEGFYGFLKVGRAGLRFFGCLVNHLVKIPKMDEGNNGTIEVRVKCFGLPEAEAKPEIMVFFFLGFGVEGEAIGAGMLQGFPAVHSFIQDEKGERASLLVGVVSGDFLHDGELFGG